MGHFQNGAKLHKNVPFLIIFGSKFPINGGKASGFIHPACPELFGELSGGVRGKEGERLMVSRYFGMIGLRLIKFFVPRIFAAMTARINAQNDRQTKKIKKNIEDSDKRSFFNDIVNL